MSIELHPFTTDAEQKAFLEFGINDYAHAMHQVGEYPTLEVSKQAAENEVRSFYETPRPGKAHYPFHLYSKADKAIVGLVEMVTLDRWGEQVGFLNFIYINPEYRRKGYAKQAITLIEEKVHELGLKTIDLNVLAHRVDAQTLYQSLGYRVIRRWVGGMAKHVTRVDMRKRLSSTLADRLHDLRQQLPMHVRLIAVSKTQPIELIQQAIAAGQREFGESYCQEAIEKIQQLNDPKLIWHFIGPIQSNKTQDIAEHFQWVHSVDRYKIAQRLNDQRPKHLPPLNICLQVNIDGEATKSGVTLKQLPELAKQVAQLPRLHLRGLMIIPAPRVTLAEQRQPFAQLRHAIIELNQQGFKLDILSMGMSDDWQAAVLEGATYIRVGTALFGSRAT